MGNVQAMAALGFIYSHESLKVLFRRRPLECVTYVDGQQAVRWFKEAFERGHCESGAALSNMYSLGKSTTKSPRLSRQYVLEALGKGCGWAGIAVLYHQSEQGDDDTLDALKKFAISGNCHAQYELHRYYRFGYLAIAGNSSRKTDQEAIEKNQNPTMAYFWGLVARSNYTGDFEKDRQWGFQGYRQSCTNLQHPDAGLNISQKYRTLAELTARVWPVGTDEPKLEAPPRQKPKIASIPKAKNVAPRPKGKPGITIRPKQKKRNLPAASASRAANYKWSRVHLPGPGTKASKTDKQPEEIFAEVNRYVWTIYSARSRAAFISGKKLSQGSGVAITKRHVITNCHVVKGRQFIVIVQDETYAIGRVVSGDVKGDRCVLEAVGRDLEFVTAIRTYDSLKVGEPVYTVGSPSGLENTLGQGIVSGLRKIGTQRLVQTTAQISPGSSGGGLFDAKARLIGITTFRLRGSQALNFAIAIEEFGEAD